MIVPTNIAIDVIDNLLEFLGKSSTIVLPRNMKDKKTVIANEHLSPESTCTAHVTTQSNCRNIIGTMWCITIKPGLLLTVNVKFTNENIIPSICAIMLLASVFIIFPLLMILNPLLMILNQLN